MADENNNFGNQYDTEPQNNVQYTAPVNAPAPQEEKASVGLAILSFFIPLAGLIIFLTKKDTRPKTAKVSGICALVSFILNILISVIMTAAGGAAFLLADDALTDDSSYSEELDYDSSTDDEANNEAIQGEIESKTEAASEAVTEQEMTLEEKNALEKAKSYLKFSAFSRKGLIDQLEFEGFSTEASEFAVDNCGADWNEQAAKKAESYLEFTSFSKSGLIDQLEFEGFTSEQAEYGASAVGY